VCRDGYTIAVHGHPYSTTIGILNAFSATINSTARVGLVARGGHLTFYLNGRQVGEQGSTQFTSGRAALGIVVPEATESTHRVSFTNVEFWAPAATG
jgi:hypothetical protein